MKERYKYKKSLFLSPKMSTPLPLLAIITPISLVFSNTIATLRYGNYTHPYYKSHVRKVFSYDDLECISDNVPNKRNLKWYADRTNYIYAPRMSLKERNRK